MQDYLQEIFGQALEKIGAPKETLLKFEKPQNPDHGDVATNVALTLAKPLRRAPRDLAVALVNAMEYDQAAISTIEVAGPGFINVRYSGNYLTNELRKLLAAGASFGKKTLPKESRVNLEWVSANPTGMLHAGHGRNVCLGAAIAQLLEWTGHTVDREYYFNNAGNQMRNLAKSVRVRYLQALGDTNIDLDEDGYRGQEIRDIGEKLKAEHGDTKREEDLSFFQSYGEAYNFENIKKTLARLNISHDIFFNEVSLYDSGEINRVIQEFRDRGLAYDKDGAVWLKLSEMGGKDDRVIVKSTGEPTYRLPDICYHINKLSRNYEFIIDIFGADHIATAADVLHAVRALGFDSDKVQVILHQMVSFVSNGELIKFSKRSGGSYTLDELLDDVGTDAAKFFFNMRAAGSHLEFDVELAKEQSDKNPVYYVQYAHARIASILRFAEQQQIAIGDMNTVDLSALNAPEEIALIKTLLRFPEVIELSAESFAPHHVCEYLRDVAATFHKFYHECRIIGSAEPHQSARLALATATKRVLANGCTVLGITAPESM